MENIQSKDQQGRIIDLLYKTSGNGSYRELSAESAKDIALYEVIEFMTGAEEEQKVLKDIMSKIPEDPADICYRQEILKDLMENESLFNTVKDSIDAIKILQFYNTGAKRIREKDNSLSGLLEELRELKVYVEVIETLSKSLMESDIKSEGLLALRETLKAISEDDNFRSVKPDIGKIHEDLQAARGAVIGVTLTADLDIENVTVIEFVDYKPRSASTIMDYKVTALASNPFNKYKYQDPLLTAMTPHLKKHLWKHFGEIKHLIRKHSKYDSRLLTNL